jgi:hypothetical protein
LKHALGFLLFFAALFLGVGGILFLANGIVLYGAPLALLALPIAGIAGWMTR